MKWALIIILIVTIMLIANAVSQQYKDKYNFYENLKLFLIKLKINISFKQEKIIKFLDNINADNFFKKFISAYKNYINNSILDFSEIKILNDEEKNELKDIIKNIGSLDAINEVQQIENYISNIEIKLKKAEEDKKKICPMIVKLSLLFSVGLAILLI